MTTTHSSLRLLTNALTDLRRRYLAKMGMASPLSLPLICSAESQMTSPWPSRPQRKKLVRHFYDLMASFTFFPDSSTLMNAGLPLRNCRPALGCR
jgi:ribonucleoside-diphosphate reductase alpha chain